MSNFIDKIFALLADLVLKLFPASKKEKEAFSYYRDGLSYQSKGRYTEALYCYYKALELEEDPYDRSFILSNVGLVFKNTGKPKKALEYLHQAISLNENLAQAYHTIGVIYHSQASAAATLNDDEETGISEDLFDKAAEYWIRALTLEPDSYPGARNWLKVSGRLPE
uniref:Hypothetical chloroplast RF3 n=1 Tax=Climaconeis cf. scalaris TaxID=2846828 RepID=A0A8F8SPI0_9STRA|nr:hypothetical chloroplast RF3 [Climaconeis cf. scalaris]